MCCEACPDYHDCAADDKLKSKCCKRCPDYEDCYGRGEEDLDIIEEEREWEE